MALTSKQRTAAERLAHNSEVVALYEEESWSGKSRTLRFREEWFEPRGGYWRRRTGMVLSVTIPDTEDRAAVAAAEADFDARAAEVRAIFRAIRQPAELATSSL